MENVTQNVKNKKTNIHNQHNYGVVQGNVYNIQHNQQNEDQVDCNKNSKLEFQTSIPITSFYGRYNELEQIKKLLTQKKTHDIPHNMVVICGIAGIGKTECAKQYINKHKYMYHNVIWIHSDTSHDIENSFKDLSKKINSLVDLDYQDIYKKLNTNPSIFVFDNIENMKILKKYLPNNTCNTFHFLLTTQNKDWGKIASIELRELETDDAINVLVQILGEKAQKVTKEKLQQLAKSLHYTPLTLQIGANYIFQQLRSDEELKEYKNLIEEYIHSIETEKHLILTEEFPDYSLNDYNNSAYTAICITLQKIKKKNSPVSKLAFTILSILSYLNPDYIKYSHLLEIKYIKNQQQLLKDSLVELMNYSFIRIEKCRYLFQEYKKVLIHRLIQECLRYQHVQHNTNHYYNMTLQLLLYEEKDFYMTVHYENILKHAEYNFHIFCDFYKLNKSERLDKLLIQYGSEVLIIKVFEKLDLKTDSSFMCTCVKNNEINIIKQILKLGADANQKLNNGNVPLHFAKSEECINVLISDGKALINMRNKEGETPLYYAFRHRPWNIAQCLIRNGADVKLCYENDRTLLHILPSMTTFSNRDLIKEKALFLLKYGANINKKDIFGITPIQEARINNALFLVEIMNSK